MGKDTGFLEFERRDPAYRPAEERLRDFKAVEMSLSHRETNIQAARCMDCGTPYCHAFGCPVSNLIPEFNDWVYREKWREALDVLLLTNNFPEFTGRICPAPCEAACVAGINGDPVTIRQIELAIIEKGFQNGTIEAQRPNPRHDKRVAVVGAGPAGMAVADTLNRAGYWVTVYDAAKSPGGILRYGIPDFKLEKWVVQRRIDLMTEEGVVFETGVRVGDDISYRYLRDRYDAVCLACGAREPRDLNIPGRDLGGIHFAMDYLSQQNKRVSGESLSDKEEILAEGKRVVVIGGGDTGSDCLGTALRQRAKEVHQLEILPRPPEKRPDSTPWPTWPNILRDTHAHKEGGDRRWGVMTTQFAGENGMVKTLHCVKVEWQATENGGLPSPVEKPGTEFKVEGDLVFLAMGFLGPEKNPIIDDLGIEKDARGNVKVDSSQMTNIPGVFVAGDMATGQSLVVRAIANGRKAAEGIMGYLAEGKKDQ